MYVIILAKETINTRVMWLAGIIVYLFLNETALKIRVRVFYKMGSEFPRLGYDDVGYITAFSRDNNTPLGIFNYPKVSTA